MDVVAGEPMPEARCEANRAAGTIRFLTGFDLAAASSIIDVVVAEDAGYFDELCLDVEILASVSPENYAFVAAGDAEFASGGSFSELISFQDSDSDLVAATVEGRTAIDTLIVRAGEAAEVTDLAGATIGVKGALPPSIDVMLRSSGLVAGEDFAVKPLPGLDPVEHLAMDDVSAIPGWKSNEIGVLERAGMGITLFDPLDAGVPGSFGVIYTSTAFLDVHPTAAEDFVRATMRGLSDAVADPTAAAGVAIAHIEAAANPMGLSLDGELFRWQTEAALILDGTPEGLGLGMPDPEVLQAEIEAYAAVGLFDDDAVLSAMDHIADGLAASVYDADQTVIWPG
ncbi:MAG: ABC transporter substrate-binding protein [Ilumatobacter sp.]